jgi:hypothetical protein
MTERFALGTRVRFHHRCAVARYGPLDVPPETRSWRLLEGVEKNELAADRTLDLLADLFSGWPEIRGGRYQEQLNKTVMVWPEEGSGVVIGVVRRGRGTSHAAGPMRSGPYGEDYDPGYFASSDFFELYAIKRGIRGVAYILAPEWALSLDG